MVGLLLALAGCAHRYPLATTEPVQALSGVPVAFGDARLEVPEDTKVRWAFGDGSSAEGAAVVHPFPFAGHFTVRETVVDRSGERSSEIAVEVARRSPMMAVPPQASSALGLDTLWSRFAVYRALLARALPSAELEPALAQVQQALGFDPADVEAVKRAGFDPAEGVASFTFADDPGGRYLAVGTWDDAKSEGTLAVMLQRVGSVRSEGPDGFSRAELADGSELYWKHDRGYLLVRLPAEAAGPALGLAHFSDAPATGLTDSPEVRELRAKLGAGDAWAYFSRDALLPPGLSEREAPVASHLHALLAKLTVGGVALSGEALWGVDVPGRLALAQLFSSSDAPSLASRAPSGAALYLGLSANLSQWLKLVAHGAPGARSRAELQLSQAGLDLDALLDQLGDAGAVAAYFDAAEFYRGLAQSESLLPRGEVLVGLRTANPAAALALATGLLASDGRPPGVRKMASGTRLESTVGGHPAGAFVGAHELLLAWGLRRLDVAIEPPSGPRLADELAEVLPADALEPGRLVLHADIAGVLDALELKQPVPGVPPDQLLRAQLFARIATASFAPLRDFNAVVEPEPEGLHARFTLRLRPR